MNIVIPMAGLGSRFATANYALPKPLIDVNGVPMIVRAIDSLAIKGQYHFLVRTSEHSDAIVAAVQAICPDANFCFIDYVTEGAAQSVLLFKEEINNDDELIVANCDQIMAWDADAVLQEMRQYDGAVVTIVSSDPKHSYVATSSHNYAERFAEKQVISNMALTGIHYWRHGRDYVASAESMIDADDRAANGEFYVAPTYNYLIKQGQRIGVCPIADNEIHFVGTPTDLETYLASR
jgi:NDP-sugar pyrophosphorylase family protein